MTKEGSTQIVNFMTPGARVLMLGCGHISHIVNIFHSFNIQHIDCYCVKGLWCCFPIPYGWFSFILRWGCWYIQIWAPLTRNQCKVSDNQVTVKACGPLVVGNDINSYLPLSHKAQLSTGQYLAEILWLMQLCDYYSILFSRPSLYSPLASLSLSLSLFLCLGVVVVEG